jgi:hypothetical protein
LEGDRGDRPVDSIFVDPVLVVSQSFPARPASLPEIRDFVQRHLAESPLADPQSQELREAILAALLDAAGPEGRVVQVSFRFLPDSVEVDVLHTPASPSDLAVPDRVRPEDRPFADWMAGMLRREGLTQEAAARQLGVSVKTVSRWVGGETEPRLRDLRRIRQVFGEAPIP